MGVEPHAPARAHDELALEEAPLARGRDPVAVEQIVHKLLLNAMQAMQQQDADARRIDLAYGPASDSRHCEVRVCDNGPGIAPEVLPRIFEQSTKLTTLGQRPLVVLMASENLSTEGWSAAQDRLAALSSDSIHRDVSSSHAGLVDDRSGADASVAAIRSVVRSVSAGSPVSPS